MCHRYRGDRSTHHVTAKQACRMLLLVLKDGGLLLVFCASDEDFMVVIVVVICQFDEQEVQVKAVCNNCNECMCDKRPSLF
jgi:hypothetical protein